MATASDAVNLALICTFDDTIWQWFKNNPANGEFRRAESLKFLCFAVFKNLLAGLDFTKCYTFGVTITAK